MGFADFFRRLLPNQTIKIAGDASAYAFDTSQTAAEISLYAMFVVAEQVANIVSKCEFKTIYDGKETRGYEWISLNYRPNKNQSSTEFWKEVIFKLLTQNEVLIVPLNNQKIIADSFLKEDYAVAESIFTNISRGTFSFYKNYRSSEVFYLKYSNQNLAVMLNTINLKYAGLFEEAYQKYICSGGQKGVLDISARAMAAPDFEEKYDEVINKRFEKFFKLKNAVLPMFDGMKYTNLSADASKKASNEISDIKGIIDEALSRAAQLYKMPPQLIRGEVSGIDDAINYMLTVCIDPLLNLIGEEFTSKEFTDDEIVGGCCIEADCSCIKHVDMFDVADKADKLIGDGLANVDELRPRIGLQPTGTAEGSRFYKTKNLAPLDNGGGEIENKDIKDGENNAKPEEALV